ncbi:MAG: prepilin-type N-terminal cleavage/methylation domain-containing protein [Planctomycetaceae bacterium]|jgi:hypothetical protein|nr:prepilin-type N-terminal cleavage/methylation domain-containing protein [Planctomycetaceae bacterium]
MHALAPTAVSRHPRAGLSLLEVLVACGILAVGLASVSALLPAASARLGQATQQDRGGVLAANARAECVNCGLVAADIFSSGTRACVFGELRGMPATGVTGSATNRLAQRTGTSTFQLADDPAFRWGAMLIPASGTAAAGLPATLSIAVFRKAPTISGTIRLNGGTSSPRFQLTSGTALRDEATRLQFLPACSHAVALTNPPRWVRVTSSWTMPGPITSGSENPALRRSFVVIDPNPLTSGTILNVIGFDGLLRLDQYPVTLD